MKDKPRLFLAFTNKKSRRVWTNFDPSQSCEMAIFFWMAETKFFFHL